MGDRDGGYHFKPTPELREALARRGELRVHTRNFLLAGGLLAGHSDGEFSPEERECLVLALAGLFDDPEAEIEWTDSPALAIDMLRGSMAWLRDNGGGRRMELYRHLAAIVAADGVFAPNELRYMQNVAAGLGIPLDDALAIIQREFDLPADPD